jgi:membrane protein implicated in regulation of membrane protease activity
MILTALGWLSTILCLLGNLFVVRKKNGFLIWFIGTGIMLVLAILRKDWSQTTLFTIYEIINLWGYFSWRKQKNNIKEYNNE